MTDVEIDALGRALEVLVSASANMKKLVRTPRELIFLRIGLSASHLEEALATGDALRARAHAHRVVELLRELRKT